MTNHDFVQILRVTFPYNKIDINYMEKPLELIVDGRILPIKGYIENNEDIKRILEQDDFLAGFISCYQIIKEHLSKKEMDWVIVRLDEGLSGYLKACDIKHATYHLTTFYSEAIKFNNKEEASFISSYLTQKHGKPFNCQQGLIQ